MKNNNNFKKIGDLIKNNKFKRQIKRPPAYEWQDFALRIIKELSIPNFKRSSVFKVCKENPIPFVEKCLNDTKELCKTGEKWKYFFKIVNS